MVLRDTPGTTQAVQSKNEIRKSIKSVFPLRDCHTLVRPMHEEKALQNLDTLDPSLLRPEFRQGLKQLIGLVFQRTKPKNVCGAVMTGAMFAGLAKVYIDAMNTGAVPAITNAWQVRGILHPSLLFQFWTF
jgi:hypothetical protein